MMRWQIVKTGSRMFRGCQQLCKITTGSRMFRGCQQSCKINSGGIGLKMWPVSTPPFSRGRTCISQFREGLGPIPEMIRSVIGSVISCQLTISRSDRISRMILLRSDHDPGRSYSLRGSVLDLVTIIATLGLLQASRRVGSPSIETGLQIWKN